MLQKFKKYRGLALLVSLLFVTAGCGSIGSNSSADNKNSGTIKLSISQKNSTKTILPDIDMTPATYTVTGAGPDAAEFARSITDVSAEIPELAFGNWIVTVDALNANNQVIARGSEAVTVHTGETATADITVTPLAGNGTLNVTLEWTSGDTEVPSIEAQLINSSDVVQDLTFTISSIEGTSTGTFSDSALPAGYYVLSVKLLDNNIQTMGAVEIVRIVEGAASTGSFIFNEINKPGGTIIANILADMEEPIEVSMSDIPAELAKGTTTEVTASVPDGVGDVRYTWFINGEQQHIGSTADPVYTIPVDTLKTDGVYRIDLVAFTLDGKRGGSATDTFRVTEADPGPGCTENVYDGDYTIMTQDDIDALSGYTKIAGNLLIGDVEAAISGETPNGSIPVETYFTDLAGLECLTHIEGYLGIANNNALTSLTGLNNLKNIDGAELESEYGDINLVTIRLMYNSVLTNIDELNNLPPVCGSMMILGNASLTNLDGLSNLTTVTGYFAIDRNMSLANIDGLANLTTISDYLYIGDNRPLTNLDGFNNLGSIGKALTITSSSLTTLNGFNNLTTIGQSLGIRNNSTLTNIEGFNSLTSVGRSLSITGNDVLTNIDGFNSLCSVANSISISYNDELCENTAEALRDQVLSCPGGGSGVSGSISDNKICP